MPMTFIFIVSGHLNLIVISFSEGNDSICHECHSFRFLIGVLFLTIVKASFCKRFCSRILKIKHHLKTFTINDSQKVTFIEMYSACYHCYGLLHRNVLLSLNVRTLIIILIILS